MNFLAWIISSARIILLPAVLLVNRDCDAKSIQDHHQNFSSPYQDCTTAFNETSVISTGKWKIPVNVILKLIVGDTTNSIFGESEALHTSYQIRLFQNCCKVWWILSIAHGETDLCHVEFLVLFRKFMKRFRQDLASNGTFLQDWPSMFSFKKLILMESQQNSLRIKKRTEYSCTETSYPGFQREWQVISVLLKIWKRIYTRIV